MQPHPTSAAVLVTLLATLAAPAAAQQESAPPATAQVPAPPVVAVPDPVALVGGTVFRMDGTAPERATVIVRDGRIEAVGRDLEPPDDCARLDVTGLFVVPGLIDGAVNHDPEHDALYVARGVTLVRDTGNRMSIIAERRAPERERVPGPDLYVAGPVIDGPQSATTDALRLASPAEARGGLERLAQTLVERAQAHGLASDGYDLDYLSFHRALDPATWREVLAFAHAHGLAAWGPLPQGVSLELALEAEQDGLFGLDALLPPQARWPEAGPDALAPAVARLAAARTAITPLVSTFARRLGQGALEDDGLLRQLSPFYEQSWRAERARWDALRETQGDALERAATNAQAALQALWKAGVTLVPGSGAPHPGLFPGLGLVDELEGWVQAGIPPLDVLERATAGAARSLGIADRRGSLAPGRVADLVVLGADPRSTLASFRDPELVVLRGRVLEREDLLGRVDETIRFQDAARALQDAPLDVPPIDLTEVSAADKRLEGTAETLAFGRRVSAERFAVYALPDGRWAYASRIVTPATLETPELHLQLVQVFHEDRLDEFRLQARPLLDQVPEAERERYLLWEVRGGMIASTGLMNIQRRTQFGPAEKTAPAPDPISLVDLSDVLSAMILGRHGREGTLYALDVVGPTFEPVADRWQLSVAPDDHRLQFVAASGLQGGFVLDERGVPTACARRTGNGVTEVRLGEVTVLGAGLPPLPASRVFVPAAAPDGGAGGDGRAPAGTTEGGR